MEKIIENQCFGEERALYNLRDTYIKNCSFSGVTDGESALKEARNIKISGCDFQLRYPLWHTNGFSMDNCEMTDGCRAALWYTKGGVIENSHLCGIKALRECENIEINNSTVVSSEFGWKCRSITLTGCNVTSEYLFLDSSDVLLRNVEMSGKYSFQYMKNLVIEDSVLNTKDAFWHSENVTVKNSIVRGEYLGWFSKNLTLVNCRIEGTQPLCYCEGLRLIDCTMEGADLAFEYSHVEADITGHIVSVKNPASGKITCDSVGEVIFEDAVMDCTGQVEIR